MAAAFPNGAQFFDNGVQFFGKGVQWAQKSAHTFKDRTIAGVRAAKKVSNKLFGTETPRSDIDSVLSAHNMPQYGPEIPLFVNKTDVIKLEKEILEFDFDAEAGDHGVSAPEAAVLMLARIGELEFQTAETLAHVVEDLTADFGDTLQPFLDGSFVPKAKATLAEFQEIYERQARVVRTVKGGIEGGPIAKLKAMGSLVFQGIRTIHRIVKEQAEESHRRHDNQFGEEIEVKDVPQTLRVTDFFNAIVCIVVLAQILAEAVRGTSVVCSFRGVGFDDGRPTSRLAWAFSRMVVDTSWHLTTLALASKLQLFSPVNHNPTFRDMLRRVQSLTVTRQFTSSVSWLVPGMSKLVEWASQFNAITSTKQWSPLAAGVVNLYSNLAVFRFSVDQGFFDHNPGSVGGKAVALATVGVAQTAMALVKLDIGQTKFIFKLCDYMAKKTTRMIETNRGQTENAILKKQNMELKKLVADLQTDELLDEERKAEAAVTVAQVAKSTETDLAQADILTAGEKTKLQKRILKEMSKSEENVPTLFRRLAIKVASTLSDIVWDDVFHMVVLGDEATFGKWPEACVLFLHYCAGIILPRTVITAAAALVRRKGDEKFGDLCTCALYKGLCTVFNPFYNAEDTSGIVLDAARSIASYDPFGYFVKEDSLYGCADLDGNEIPCEEELEAPPEDYISMCTLLVSSPRDLQTRGAITHT